jgi:G:T/U-mismatch repair DNA glycosylase
MSVDVRINVGVWNHPKWLRLRAKCGQDGLLALIRLWCWTGEYRDEGRLHGVSDEEIESVAPCSICAGPSATPRAWSRCTTGGSTTRFARRVLRAHVRRARRLS